MATRATKASRSTPAKPVDKAKWVGPVCTTPPADPAPSADEIRLHAYLRWQAAGKPVGDGVKFWLEAEHALLQVK
jgi:hypothetical protein